MAGVGRRDHHSGGQGLSKPRPDDETNPRMPEETKENDSIRIKLSGTAFAAIRRRAGCRAWILLLQMVWRFVGLGWIGSDG